MPGGVSSPGCGPSSVPPVARRLFRDPEFGEPSRSDSPYPTLGDGEAMKQFRSLDRGRKIMLKEAWLDRQFDVLEVNELTNMSFILKSYDGNKK